MELPQFYRILPDPNTNVYNCRFLWKGIGVHVELFKGHKQLKGQQVKMLQDPPIEDKHRAPCTE